MIEIVWPENDPDNNDFNNIKSDARVFKVKDLNALILVADFPYEANGVQLSTYEHKNVLLKLHNATEDHLFSITDYNHEIMCAFADRITESLIEKGCILMATTIDDQFLMATDLGISVNSGLTPLNLDKDESDFLDYIIKNSYPIEIDDIDSVDFGEDR